MEIIAHFSNTCLNVIKDNFKKSKDCNNCCEFLQTNDESIKLEMWESIMIFFWEQNLLEESLAYK